MTYGQKRYIVQLLFYKFIKFFIMNYLHGVTAVPGAQQDALTEKVNCLLENENVSTKVEAVIHYLYRGKVVPFTLSDIEEEELFKTMKKKAGDKEAFVILKDYIDDYGLKSDCARKIFDSLKQSYEIADVVKNSESLVAISELEELTPYKPRTTPLKEDEIVSDDELKKIVEEVENEMQHSFDEDEDKNI